jgi:hypothetical protein
MQSQLTVYEILNLHEYNLVPSALSNSIGDGFLIQNNTLYKNLRSEFIRLGYSFTTEDFCHYISMPFLSLTEILKQKKVPYFDNVSPIQKIEKLHPRKFKCEDIIKPKTNHVLHESAHCVAEEYLSRLNFKIDFISKEQNIALRMIMAESFANTVESVSNFWNTSAEQRLFFEMNSYIIYYKKISHALNETVNLIGFKNAFDLIYISYLHSNLLLNEMTASQFQRVVSAFFDSKTAELISNSKAPAKIFNHAFELSMDFRLQTTGFYCQIIGLKSDLFELVHIDIVQLLKNSMIVQSFLKQSEHLLK